MLRGMTNKISRPNTMFQFWYLHYRMYFIWCTPDTSTVWPNSNTSMNTPWALSILISDIESKPAPTSMIESPDRSPNGRSEFAFVTNPSLSLGIDTNSFHHRGISQYLPYNKCHFTLTRSKGTIGLSNTTNNANSHASKNITIWWNVFAGPLKLSHLQILWAYAAQTIILHIFSSIKFNCYWIWYLDADFFHVCVTSNLRKKICGCIGSF